MNAPFEVVAELNVEVRVVTRYRVVHRCTGHEYAYGARSWADAMTWLLARPGLVGIAEVQMYEVPV